MIEFRDINKYYGKKHIFKNFICQIKLEFYNTYQLID